MCCGRKFQIKRLRCNEGLLYVLYVEKRDNFTSKVCCSPPHSKLLFQAKSTEHYIQNKREKIAVLSLQKEVQASASSRDFA